MRIEEVENRNDKVRIILYEILGKQGIISKKEQKEYRFLCSRYMFVGTEKVDIMYWLKEQGFIATVDAEWIDDNMSRKTLKSLFHRKLEVTTIGREALSKLFHSELKESKRKSQMEWFDRVIDFKVVIAAILGILLREIFSVLEVVWKFLLQTLSLLQL